MYKFDRSVERTFNKVKSITVLIAIQTFFEIEISSKVTIEKCQMFKTFASKNSQQNESQNYLEKEESGVVESNNSESQNNFHSYSTKIGVAHTSASSFITAKQKFPLIKKPSEQSIDKFQQLPPPQEMSKRISNFHGRNFGRSMTLQSGIYEDEHNNKLRWVGILIVLGLIIMGMLFNFQNDYEEKESQFKKSRRGQKKRK